jgi:hypothetical protein
LPVPVTLKRFLALDLVFIFGISVSFVVQSDVTVWAHRGMPYWPDAPSRNLAITRINAVWQGGSVQNQG